MDKSPAFSELTIREAIGELSEMGNGSVAEDLERLVADPKFKDSELTKMWESGLKIAWQHKSAAYGFINTDGSICAASNVISDSSLIKERINLKFDGFFAKNLPGVGEHEVAIQWSAHHFEQSDNTDKATTATTAVSFTQKYLMRDGQASADVGRPIFYNLRVPPAGIGFEMKVVYLKNASAERLLSFLDTPAVKEGLTLISSVNPALGPLTSMAKGIVGGLLANNDGRTITEPFLGLDSQSSASGARLRTGTYVVIQTETPQFPWLDWTFENGVLKHKAGQEMAYNYFLLRVERATD